MKKILTLLAVAVLAGCGGTYGVGNSSDADVPDVLSLDAQPRKAPKKADLCERCNVGKKCKDGLLCVSGWCFVSCNWWDPKHICPEDTKCDRLGSGACIPHSFSQYCEGADVPEPTPVENNYEALFCEDIDNFEPSSNHWMCKCFGGCSHHFKCHSECGEEQTCYYCQMKTNTWDEWARYISQPSPIVSGVLPKNSDFIASTDTYIWATKPNTISPGAGLMVMSGEEVKYMCLIDGKHHKLNLLVKNTWTSISLPHKTHYKITLSYTDGEVSCSADNQSVFSASGGLNQRSDLYFYTSRTRACFRNLSLRTVHFSWLGVL